MAKGFFPLLFASQMGHIDVMQTLMDAGADVNQVEGTYYISSLFTAAMHNHPRAIALLVRNGGDVNLAISDGSTPLFIAAQQGQKEAVIALLVAKAAVNQARNEGAGPVFIAAQEGHADVLKLLMYFDLGCIQRMGIIFVDRDRRRCEFGELSGRHASHHRCPERAQGSVDCSAGGQGSCQPG